MIKRVGWCVEAESGLNVSLGSDMPVIREEVECGVSVLWSMGAGWMITRVEGRELVIVALENCNVKKVSKIIVDHARKQGFRTLRAHVENPAFERLLSKYSGFSRESVLRMVL